MLGVDVLVGVGVGVDSNVLVGVGVKVADKLEQYVPQPWEISTEKPLGPPAIIDHTGVNLLQTVAIVDPTTNIVIAEPVLQSKYV